MALPKPPASVPACTDIERLAPNFKRDVTRLLIRLRERGLDPIVAETFRSAERWKYLYGFGREYDDGRGVVTKATSPETTWHFFCLAADIVSERHGWNAPDSFWNALGEEAKALGLAWGGDWEFQDKPHVQVGPPMRRSPSPLAAQIVAEHGLEGLWRVVGAAA